MTITLRYFDSLFHIGSLSGGLVRNHNECASEDLKELSIYGFCVRGLVSCC